MKGRKKRRLVNGHRGSYLAALLVSFVPAFIWGGYIPYALLFLCLLTPVFSVFHAVFLLLQLRAAQSLPERVVVRGDKAPYGLELYNRGPFPLADANAVLMEGRGYSVSRREAGFALLPWQKKRLQVEVEFIHRGVFELGVQSLKLSDLFSLVRLGILRKPRLEIMVTPKVILLDSLAMSQFSELESGVHFKKSSEEAMKDTRKYEYGDPVSRIHWNLTARKSELITKLFESESELDVLFLLDLSPVYIQYPFFCEDFLIEFCVAIVRHVLSASRSVRLAYAQAGEIKTIKGSSLADFGRFYSELSRAAFNSSLGLYELAAQAGLSQYGILLTAREPPEEILAALASAGRADCYYLETKTGKRRETFDENGPVRVYGLLPEDDIKKFLENGS